MDDLRCEYLVNPLGIDARAPRLSWKLAAVRPEARETLGQSAYSGFIVAPSKRYYAKTRERSGTAERSRRISRCTWFMRGRRWRRTTPAGGRCVCGIKTATPRHGAAHLAAGRWDCSMPGTESGQWIGWDGGEETEDPSAMFQAASWIWYPGGKATVGAPIGTRFFRATFNLPVDRRGARRRLLMMAADDSFVAHVNGRPIGGGSGWAEVKRMDVTGPLRATSTRSPSPPRIRPRRTSHPIRTPRG